MRARLEIVDGTTAIPGTGWSEKETQSQTAIISCFAEAGAFDTFDEEIAGIPEPKRRCGNSMVCPPEDCIYGA